MTGERRMAVTGAPAVRARALPEDAAPSGAQPIGPERPGSDPPDSDPPDTGPFRSASFGPVPPGRRNGHAEARALIRTQLRIALGTCAVVLTVVAGLPVLLALVPAVAQARVHGVPLWWPVLVVGVQPGWVVVARWQLRRAERAERELTRPVGGP